MTKHLSIPASTEELFGDREPAPEQMAAVTLAASNAVVVITGGPGVGKTFTVNAVIRLFEANGLAVTCCAPTGKAAQRMKEQTGKDASTIHRLLGSRLNGDSLEPLATDAVILDEASMVDAELMSALVTYIPDGARLVIVGDVDQLPSIGAGRVLHDIIESGAVPVVRLTRIFRQASESMIPYIARDVNSGTPPDLSKVNTSKDVLWVESEQASDVAALIVRAFKQGWPQLGIKRDDIQVLAPQRSGPCGVVALNNTLQRELNPQPYKAQGVKVGADYVLFTGDRVIHCKNNYQLMTFNGEIGKVVAADWQGVADIGDAVHNGSFPRNGEPTEPKGKFVVVVDFGDRRVAYHQDEAKDLQLAYCITIHKSQGSQFKAVMMPVHSSHNFMLTRPLVYTAITRAERVLLMLGEERALGGACVNTRGVARRTTLASRLASEVG